MHAGASTNNADSSASGEPQRSYCNNLVRPSPLAASAVRVAAALAQPLRIVHTARSTASNLPVLNVVFEAISIRGSVHSLGEQIYAFPAWNGITRNLSEISCILHPAGYYIVVGIRLIVCALNALSHRAHRIREAVFRPRRSRHGCF